MPLPLVPHNAKDLAAHFFSQFIFCLTSQIWLCLRRKLVAGGHPFSTRAQLPQVRPTYPCRLHAKIMTSSRQQCIGIRKALRPVPHRCVCTKCMDGSSLCRDVSQRATRVASTLKHTRGGVPRWISGAEDGRPSDHSDNAHAVVAVSAVVMCRTGFACQLFGFQRQTLAVVSVTK